MRVAAYLWRSCRLRCPACGQGRVFAGWLKMIPRCERCGLKIERGRGFYLGSIYINYGVTTVLLVVAYFALFFLEEISPGATPAALRPASWELHWLLVAFALVFPLLFFRHARCLWLALNEYYDPSPRGKPKPDRKGTPGEEPVERSAR